MRYAMILQGSASATSNHRQDPIVSYQDSVIGAAIFDLNGLPKEYFLRPEGDMNWVQTVFQGIGLQSLLASSLQLDGFRHVIVTSSKYRAVVVKQRHYYGAVLFPPSPQSLARDWVNWVYEFDLAGLHHDPRFRAV